MINCHVISNTEDNIMDASTYNLEDCTTDMTCIQADENNLFTDSRIKIYIFLPKLTIQF